MIDELSMDKPQTKQIASLLKALDLENKSALITTEAHDPMVYKSARNISRVVVSRVSDLNAFEILRPHRVLMTRAALDAFKERATTA